MKRLTYVFSVDYFCILPDVSKLKANNRDENDACVIEREDIDIRLKMKHTLNDESVHRMLA
ncbi:hypothetical protein GCM10007938_07620 [Vibrio zhanjiangensis]|uniref:Uncharacterized protein n=1 Tax=Vibrio zhanjiangensis TaxID=1046128 RepID=A0ABQ6EWU9_9VIBR|nr:hypothetical protein GCM10007938_07620 [Vibrio zhanjiangensis]